MGRCSRLFNFFLFISAFCAALLGCTRERDLVDEQVRQLCAKDGGVRVLERVMVSSERFNEFHQPRVHPRKLAEHSDEYFYDQDTTYLKHGSPDLVRFHYKLVRRKDQRVLGEAISYARRGGDLPGPGHPTYFICPSNADINDLASQVFIDEREIRK